MTIWTKILVSGREAKNVVNGICEKHKSKLLMQVRVITTTENDDTEKREKPFEITMGAYKI